MTGRGKCEAWRKPQTTSFRHLVYCFDDCSCFLVILHGDIMFIHFLVVLFVWHQDKNSAKYYFPTPEEKRKARIDAILMQIEQSHS